jgi:hypothetical protein
MIILPPRLSYHMLPDEDLKNERNLLQKGHKPGKIEVGDN